MATQTLKSLHPFLQENTTPTPHSCTVQSFSHDTGSGPILILVHGWPQSSYMWRHVISSWSKTYSLFIPELPGYGLSSPPPDHNKRTFGSILLSALTTVIPNSPTRPLIWIGHDRGARIGHRLLVDQTHPPSTTSTPPLPTLLTAILIDIVPTLSQWQSFAHPAASVAYHHWPFLARPSAPALITAMGEGVYVRDALARATGQNAAGAARFREDDAVEHYAARSSGREAVEGMCGDYAAGAGVDVDLQREDLEAGRKVGVKGMLIYSTGNLGRMHDVEGVWREWVDEGTEWRMEGIGEGHGHYLPEECPERIMGLVGEWLAHVGLGK